jgi:DNA polymerase I-like protein with 3'-5' exonuclease and polymerase domains
MAMVKIHKAGIMDDFPMLLTVHDELDFSIPHDLEGEAKKIIEEQMVNLEGLKVPLLVDSEFGSSWGEVK